MILNLLERHRDKWVEDGECYRWTGALAGNPKSLQGCVGWNGKVVRVPRVMCEEAHGPPPTPKHHAAHDTLNGCIGGLCVNGEHLRWATARENAADIPPEVRSDRIYRGKAKIKKDGAPMWVHFNKRVGKYKVVCRGKFLGYFLALNEAIAALDKYLEGAKD